MPDQPRTPEQLAAALQAINNTPGQDGEIINRVHERALTALIQTTQIQIEINQYLLEYAMPQRYVVGMDLVELDHRCPFYHNPSDSRTRCLKWSGHPGDCAHISKLGSYLQFGPDAGSRRD